MYTLTDPSKWTNQEQQHFIFECGVRGFGRVFIMKAQTNVDAIEAIRDNLPKEFPSIVASVIEKLLL